MTKPVRRCYLSSLAGVRQSFSSPASPALTTLQSERNGSFERAVENGSVAPTRSFADRTPPQSCRSRREKASLDCLLPVRTEERGFCLMWPGNRAAASGSNCCARCVHMTLSACDWCDMRWHHMGEFEVRNLGEITGNDLEAMEVVLWHLAVLNRDVTTRAPQFHIRSNQNFCMLVTDSLIALLSHKNSLSTESGWTEKAMPRASCHGEATKSDRVRYALQTDCRSANLKPEPVRQCDSWHVYTCLLHMQRNSTSEIRKWLSCCKSSE